MHEKEASYGAKDMTILEGLAHVRKRAGMYIGGTGLAGLHHLVWEVVDNCVDEAMAGHATHINITLQPDGSCMVEDNGRGIPTDMHPGFKMSGHVFVFFFFFFLYYLVRVPYCCPIQIAALATTTALTL